MGKGVDVEKSIQTWWSTDQKIKELKEKIKEDEKTIKSLNKEHKEQEQTIIQEMLNQEVKEFQLGNIRVVLRSREAKPSIKEAEFVEVMQNMFMLKPEIWNQGSWNPTRIASEFERHLEVTRHKNTGVKYTLKQVEANAPRQLCMPVATDFMFHASEDMKE